MVLVCPACGTENRAVAKFCIECIGVLPTGFATTDISPRLDVPPVPARDARASFPTMPPRGTTQPTPMAATARRPSTERQGESGASLEGMGAPVQLPPEIESRRGLWVSVAAFAIALCVGAAGWMIAGAGGWYIYSASTAASSAAAPATMPVVEGLVPAPAGGAASMSAAATRPSPGASAALAATAAALVPIEAAAPPNGASNGGVVAAPAGSSGAVTGGSPPGAGSPGALTGAAASATGSASQRPAANVPVAQGSGPSATAAAATAATPAASGSRRTAPKPRPAAVPDAAAEVAAPARPSVGGFGAPSAQCAGLGYFATSRCMAAQCLVANFRAHPECEAVRQQQRLMEEKRNPANFN